MVTIPETHDVALLAPWYVTAPQNVAIHRYLDSGFVAQFQADVSSAPQNNANLFKWQSEDRVSATDTRLKLRRPVHRTFHMVAWEASCKMATAPAGYPAIPPAKIASAGFVLRDVSGASPLGFYIEKGKPKGWGPISSTTGDPDAARRLKSLSLVPRQAAPSPGYTGEETFPLHPLSVSAAGRPHTLLYGYLPIGGGDYVSQTSTTPDNGETNELPWPFGLANYSNGPPALYTVDQQIIQGVIQSPLAALLRILLGRYQLADPEVWAYPDPITASLIKTLNLISFYPDPPSSLSGNDLRQWAAKNALPLTLGSLLQQWTAPGSAPSQPGVVSLPNASMAQVLLSSLDEAYPSGTVNLPAAPGLEDSARNVLVLESAAESLRYAQSQSQAPDPTSPSTLPTAKLVSGSTGYYAVVPFVRVVRPDGCEKVFWGAYSPPFAVAAMFDPDAARPTLIEMPDLADAMRGSARGASFSMPPKLADLANGMSTSSAIKAFLQSGTPPSSGLGIGYICSFSLPAISICAMIALSIILCLLNIFLGWMAWVKICLPIPQKEPSG
jgi:hypothetical protein